MLTRARRFTLWGLLCSVPQQTGQQASLSLEGMPTPFLKLNRISQLDARSIYEFRGKTCEHQASRSVVNTCFAFPPTTSNMFGAPKPATGGGLFSSTPSGGATGFSFGQQSQQQQPQQSQQQQPPPGGGLFGQQPQQQQQPSIGGLFGSKPTGAGTGLFGSAGTNPGGGGTGGGLFGEAATSAPTSNPSGGLFGQPSTAASAAGAPKPLSLGNASTTQTGAGMFGQQPQQQQSSAVGGGLFGFGQQTNTGAQQQQGGSLFGQRPGGAFGTSTFGPSAPGSQPFGAATTAATQTQPQNHFLQFPYHQKERFNDLPDQQKQLVEQLEYACTNPDLFEKHHANFGLLLRSQFIQQQVQTRKQLEASKDAEEISKASQEIWSIQSVSRDE